MVLLVALKNRQQVRLRKATNVIGRGPSCDIILRVADISKRHCRIHFDGKKVTVEDLQSMNGIKVNGRVVKRGELRDGDCLHVASHALEISVQKPLKDTRRSKVPLRSRRPKPRRLVGS